MIDSNSRVRDIYDHPVGKDVIDKILMQMNKSDKWILNPIVKNLKLSFVEKLATNKLSPGFWDQLYWLLNLEKDLPNTDQVPMEWKWWKEAVFYQIYPRSFADSNSDGIGDIQGIISKLDYLESLGIDAIWLSPIYDSPNDDNGYDIRDYKKIMSEMGTMEDFNLLLDEVHKRGMKLIMDFVVNHTSDEHEWFKKALENPEGPYGSYYFFKKPKDGKEPNNWVSFFSGPAWNYYPEHDLYALHLFSKKQMDLNWDHEPLRKEIHEMISWWLEKGVDGFRLDVINYISKREGLPDGNETIGDLIEFTGIENYFYGPRLHEYLREMRAETFDKYGAFSVAETPGIGLEMGKLLSGADRKEFDLIFNFDHLETPGHVRFDDYEYDLNFLKNYYINYQKSFTNNNWMSIFWENHDNPRMASKVTSDKSLHEPLSKLLIVLLLTMRGTPFVYQGQELGATNYDFTSIEQLKDVEVINYYKDKTESIGSEAAWKRCLAGTRDHARVPMVWDSSKKYGAFSDVEPWLYIEDDRKGVNMQEQDSNSVLNFFKNVMSLRKSQTALRRGEIEFVRENDKDYFAYYRNYEGERVFVEMNLSDKSIALEEKVSYTEVVSNYDDISDRLKPYEARIYLI